MCIALCVRRPLSTLMVVSIKVLKIERRHQRHNRILCCCLNTACRCADVLFILYVLQMFFFLDEVVKRRRYSIPSICSISTDKQMQIDTNKLFCLPLFLEIFVILIIGKFNYSVSQCILFFVYQHPIFVSTIMRNDFVFVFV